MFIAVLYASGCETLQYFAYGLNMHLVNATIYQSILNDCCSAQGVTCIGPAQNRVIKALNWNGLGLNGTLNGTANLQNLTSLGLASNKIVGRFSEMGPLLEIVDIRSNKQTGPLPFLSDVVKNFRIDNSKINGTLPSQWPIKLVTFVAQHNLLTGTIPSPLPDTVTYLMLMYNKITGSLPFMGTKINRIWVSSNLLTGFVPPIPQSMLTFRIDNNRIKGEVFLQRPISIAIQGNEITNIVVNNTEVLNQGCDLSRNPLLGNPNITNLVGKCRMDDLLDPSITDCMRVGEIAISLKLNTINSDLFASMTLNCCTSKGITCDTQLPNGHVKSIDWSGLSLNGTISSISQLVELEKLNLSNQPITGSLTSIPPSLKSLNISNTFIAGELQFPLPEIDENGDQVENCILNVLDLSNSWSSGSLSYLPDSLEVLRITGSQIRGIMPINFPPLAMEWNSGNHLSGKLPSFVPYSLQFINISYANMTGDVAIFPFNVKSLYLSYNQLNGYLQLRSPKVVLADHNNIDAIKIYLIVPMVCDISFNRLSLNNKIDLSDFCKVDIETISSTFTTTQVMEIYTTTIPLVFVAPNKQSLLSLTVMGIAKQIVHFVVMLIFMIKMAHFLVVRTTKRPTSQHINSQF